MSNQKKNTPPLQDGQRRIQLADGRVMQVPVKSKENTITFVPPKTKTSVATKEVKVQLLHADGPSDFRLREENVQEILTAVPHWMIRWGNLLFGTLIALLLLLAWMVKYPEMLRTTAQVFNKFPEQQVFIDKDKSVQTILVSTGDPVFKGSVLAILESEAQGSDVLLLQSILDTLPTNSKDLVFPFHQLPPLYLGALQAPFAQFENSYLTYTHHQDEKQSHSLPRQASFQKVLQDYQQLKDALASWSDQHLLRSQINGHVGAVAQGQMEQGENQNLLLTIVPENPPQYVAQLELPLLNSGKIQAGQKVLLKLDNYPEMEFGILEGVLATDHKTLSTSGNTKVYRIEADLPNQLLTSYDKELAYQEHLTGSGEIIIGEARLLERFFSIIK